MEAPGVSCGALVRTIGGVIGSCVGTPVESFLVPSSASGLAS